VGGERETGKWLMIAATGQGDVSRMFDNGTPDLSAWCKISLTEEKFWEAEVVDQGKYDWSVMGHG